MKVKNIISALVLGSCIATTASYADTKPLLKIKPSNHIELLFVQHASSGLIKPGSTGCYELLLSHLDPNILYFANSPNRVSGHLTLAQFAETMQHSQVADKVNPNAVLDMKISGSTASTSIVGSLSNASFADNQFHYTFCPFDGNHVIKQGQIRSIHLFVDPIHRWPP